MNFLDQLTFKQKNIGLVALAALLLFISWKKAFQGTFLLADECEAIEWKLEQVANAKVAFAQAKIDLVELDAVLGKSEDSPTVVQQALLQQVSAYCQSKKIRLNHFPAPEQRLESDYLVSTNEFEVEGSFLKLLGLAHELESEFEAARLSSVRYYSKKNRRTKKSKLYAVFSLQNISKGS